MEATRRNFLVTLVAAASCSAANGAAFAQAGPKKTPFPTPPPSAEQENPAEQQRVPATDSERAKKLAMQQNEKAFRADVAKLYQLASTLKEDVEKLATMQVLSLQMYKRTEEIEKVAKDLKAKAKG
jgi:hypothetical protein